MDDPPVVITKRLSLKKQQQNNNKKKKKTTTTKPTEKEIETKDVGGSTSSKGVKLTEAERRMFEKQRERKLAKVETKSHKDKVVEFNKRLDKKSDYNDLPRITGA
jgi:protein FAM32A